MTLRSNLPVQRDYTLAPGPFRPYRRQPLPNRVTSEWPVIRPQLRVSPHLIRLLRERPRARARFADEKISWPTVAESDSRFQDRTAPDTLRGSQTEYFQAFGMAFLPGGVEAGVPELT